MPKKKETQKEDAKEAKLFTATFRFEGKRYYVRSTDSQKDADKKAALREDAMKNGSALIEDSVRFAQYAESWLETYKKTTVIETTYNDYVSRARNHMIPEVGRLRMKDIRPTNLQKIMNNQAGKSKTHCDKMMVTLKGIFAQAVRDKIIRDNPAADLQLPKAQNGSHRSITDQERSAILLVANTHRFGLFVQTLLWCGLRPQEAIALRWSDVDVINRRLHICRALKKDGAIAETKSKAGNRSIPIPPQLFEIYEQLIPTDIDQFVFTTTKGERHSHTSLKRAWDSFKTEIDIALGAETVIYYGLPKIKRSVIASDLTMYCLRHTYCTDLEAAGVPINVAKYLMGHSNIMITAKIYTHMRDDTLADAAEKIAAFGEIGATTGATTKPKITPNNMKLCEVPDFRKVKES